MKTEDLINELSQTNTLSKDTIQEFEENSNLRLDLIQHFNENKNRDFALNLLAVLSELRRDPDEEISGDSLMLACYILGKHNQIEDCMKIWETKQIDFDTYSYIDIQLVTFLGVKATIEYLETQTSEEALVALQYITACEEAGDFDDLEEYFSDTPWFA